MLRRKGLSTVLSSLFVLALVASASAQTLTFPLEGSQEVPPVVTEATGSCDGTLNAQENGYSLTCNNNAQNITGAHIHNGATGINGPIVFFLDATTSFSANVTQASLDQQVQDSLPVQGIDFETFLSLLRSGNLYVNIHTEDNATGELRGQIPPAPFASHFAQFGNGDGLTSDIVLINSASTGGPVTGSVVLFGEDGSTLDIPLSGSPDGTFSVGEKNAVTLSTDGQGPLSVGSASVFSDGPLNGVVRFGTSATGIVGVGKSPIANKILVPAKDDGNIRTGLAIRNATGEEITVTCELKDGDDVVATAMLTIAGNARIAQFIDEIFDPFDTTNFSGVVICSSDDPFAALALEQGNNLGEFTSIPVTPVSDH